MKVSICKSGIITCVILMLASYASAADTYWTGGTGNWSPGSWDNGEPTSSVNAYINNGGTAQITSGNYEWSRYLYLGDSSGDIGAVEAAGGSLYITTYFYVGNSGNGTLDVTGGSVSSNYGYIGTDYDSVGEVTVDGIGSNWTNYVGLTIGHAGSGTLEIKNGGVVSNQDGNIGFYDYPATGEVTVYGSGSTWTNTRNLRVGTNGSGILNITDDGLVSVGGELNIDTHGVTDSFINMSTGGMLALDGDADDSINDFLNLVSPYEGTDAIRYWDGSAWENITNATEGVDYWLDYHATGDLAGYTMLTVGVPEPATMGLLGLGALGLIARRKKRK